jgi:hypothetical protein
MDRWILQTSGKNKVEFILALIRSGGVVAIGFGSTRTVDIVLEFCRFRIRGVKNVVTRSRELKLPIDEVPIELGPSDDGKLRDVY